MFTDKLYEKVEGFKVNRISGNRYEIELKEKGVNILKLGMYLYLIFAIFISFVLVASYILGAKVFDGKEIPLWFLLLVFIVEWFPLLFFAWLVFARKIFVFDYELFEIKKKVFGLVKKMAVIEKNRMQRVFLISQSDDASVFTLKVQSDDREHTVLWMTPHEKCRWLGMIIASWADVPLEE